MYSENSPLGRFRAQALGQPQGRGGQKMGQAAAEADGGVMDAVGDAVGGAWNFIMGRGQDAGTVGGAAMQDFANSMTPTVASNGRLQTVSSQGKWMRDESVKAAGRRIGVDTTNPVTSVAGVAAAPLGATITALDYGQRGMNTAIATTALTGEAVVSGKYAATPYMRDGINFGEIGRLVGDTWGDNIEVIGDNGQMITATNSITAGQGLATFYGRGGYNMIANVIPGAREAVDKMILEDSKIGLEDPNNTRQLYSWMSGLYSTWDVTNYQERESAYNQGLGRWITGASDAAIQWYVGVDVIAGKGIGKVGRTLFMRSLDSFGDVNKMTDELVANDAFRKGLAQGEILDVNGNVVRTVEAKRTDMGRLAESLVKMNEQQVLKHKIASTSTDSLLVARVLGRAKTYEQVQVGLRAMAGDMAAVDELLKMDAIAGDALSYKRQQIDRLKSVLDITPTTPLAAANKAMAEKNLGQLEDVYKAALEENQPLRDMVAALSKDGGISTLNLDKITLSRLEFGPNSVVSMEKAAEKAALRDAGGHLWKETSFFTGGKYGRKVRVFAHSSMDYMKTARQVGRVDLNDSQMVVGEIDAIFQTTPMFRRLAKMNAEALLPGTEETVSGFRERIYRKMIDAPTASARWEVMQEFDATVTRALAAHYNVAPERVAKIVSQYSSMKQGLLENVQRHGFFEDSGDIISVPQMQEALRGLDMQSKKAETYFATDFNFLETVFRLEQGSAARRTATNLSKGADELFSRFDAIWRPLVLMRLGYTQRNVAEGWLRELAAYGTIGALKDRSKGTRISEQDAAFVRWASSIGRGADKALAIPRAIKYGSVRRAIRNLDAARETSEASAKEAHKAQQSLSALIAQRDSIIAQHRKAAQERIAQSNIDRLDTMVGQVWEEIDDIARGRMTEIMDNAQEIWVPSQYVRPLLAPTSKSRRSAKTAGAFDNPEDAATRAINDESVPVSTVDDIMGVEDGIPVDEIHDSVARFMSRREAMEYSELRTRAQQGELGSDAAQRFDDLTDRAIRRAIAQRMQDGDKVVRIVDSGLYQIVHHMDEVDNIDIADGNIAVLAKENFDKVTNVRANVAGDALDLRYSTPDMVAVNAVSKMVTDNADAEIDQASNIFALHRELFGEVAEATPGKRPIEDILVIAEMAKTDPMLAEAIGVKLMVNRMPDNVRQWFTDNGLLIESSRLKRLVKQYSRTRQAYESALEDANAIRQNLVDMVDEFDWDEFAAGDMPVFHGGSKVRGDEINPDPINNVLDTGAVHKGIGFYTTDDPEIAVEYVINRAVDKDGKPTFYATTFDPNTQGFLNLDDVVDSYEAEDNLKRIFARMQEKYGDEADFDTAWDEIDGIVRDRVDDAQFSLSGDGEILDYTVDQYREAMVDYFQRRIADDMGVDVASTREGRWLTVERGEDWADTEYQAQMLWVDGVRDEGFDGVTHLGGQNFGTRDHEVFIWYTQPELTPIDELTNEAILLQQTMRKMEALGVKRDAIQHKIDVRETVAPYEAKNFDAAMMTRDGERLLGKYMEQNGIGRIYVNDSLSPSGYRLIVNPDMVSVNTDQLDAVLPGQMLTKDFTDRQFAAFQREETVRHPQVWMPNNVDDEALLSQFDGDTAVLEFLRTGKGTPETKAKVARYMETREGFDGPNPYTHVMINGKFQTVSGMLGKKRTGAAYSRTLESDEVDDFATMLVNNDPEIARLNNEIGTLEQVAAGGTEKFLADQEAAKAAAEVLRKRLGKRKASGKQAKKKIGSGTERFDKGGIEAFETDGVFSAANQGAKNALDAGSDRRVQMELYGFTDRSMRMMQRTMTPTKYEPADRMYWNTFADEINKIWRNDPVGEMLFRGMSVEEIYAGLKATDRGRAWIRDVAGISDFRGYVSKDILTEDAEQAILTEIADREEILRRLIPGSPEDQRRIMSHIADHDVTPMWLRTELGWRTDLQDLQGFGVQYEMGKNWRGFTGNVMRVLGTLPENALVRHPFYRARWREEMQRQIDIYAPQISARQGGGPAKFTDAQINAMNIAAKKRALRQVNDTLYTIQRISTPAHMFRFIVPFFPAWASSMKFWLLRMPVEKPETLARYGLAFSAPESIGMVRDENGQRINPAATEGNGIPNVFERLANKVAGADEGQLVIQMTPAVAEKMSFLTGGNSSLSISKGSLDVLLQGEHFWVPGLGPLVALPASWLASQMPDVATEIQTGNLGGLGEFVPLKELSKSLYGAVLPFGPTKEKNLGDMIAESVLPAAGARLYNAWREGNSASFSNAAMSIYQSRIIDWELNGRQGQAPDFIDAVNDAKKFFYFRAAVALTAPFATGFQSKYQFYIDEWRNTLAKANEPGGGGYEAAQSEFITKYGEAFFAATLSLSGRSSGIAPTVGEFREFEKNPELMAELGNLGTDAGFITMATRPFSKALNEDGFDPAVYAWQFNRAVEGAGGKYLRAGSGNRRDMLLDVDKEMGWYKFDATDEQLGAMLNTGAIDEDQYNSLKKTAAQRIGEMYPGWWAEYNDRGGARYIDSVKAMDAILTNEKYMQEHGDEPYVQSMVAFNDTRNQLVDMLAQRKREGGSDNIDAKSNADIAMLYEVAVKRIAESDPTGEFQKMHTRFFGSDRLLPIPGRDI